jgi:hypothetical protein
MRPTSLLVPPDPAMNNIYKSAIAQKKNKANRESWKGISKNYPTPNLHHHHHHPCRRSLRLTDRLNI